MAATDARRRLLVVWHICGVGFFSCSTIVQSPPSSPTIPSSTNAEGLNWNTSETNCYRLIWSGARSLWCTGHNSAIVWSGVVYSHVFLHTLYACLRKGFEVEPLPLFIILQWTAIVFYLIPFLYVAVEWNMCRRTVCNNRSWLKICTCILAASILAG